MQPRLFIAVVLLAALAAPSVASLSGQSLADVARKEEERRKGIKQPSKVYTDKDVKPATPADVAAADAEAAGTDKDKAPGTDKASDAQKPTEKDEKSAKGGTENAADAVKGQKQWRERMQALETALDRDQTYLDAVQNKINSLTTDFVNRDDPAQRAVIERERQKNLDELERLRKAIVGDKKAIADLEEEARRAGVPPGWLR